MKKSNALMLSYMIFLAVALLAKVIFRWEGLDQIAIGATVAGCFFAFADLSNWHVSNSALILDALQKEQNVFVAYCAVQIGTLKAQQKELEEVIVKMEPYSNQFEHAAKLVKLCSDRVAKLKQTLPELEISTKEGLSDLQSMLDKERSKVSGFRMIDIVLITFGFIVFFVLTTFDKISNFLAGYQSYATIIAFIVIMLNYFLRDIVDEHTKEKAEEILVKAERHKNAIREAEEELKKTPLLDEANELIERIEKLNNAKEDSEYGQIENALGE